MNTNNGGAAFPISASTGDPRDGVYCHEGMSLRDYFAAKAMQGWIAAAGVKREDGKELWAKEGSIAEHAYAVADAMLKAREATNE
jgi:hypothetical protein